MEEIDRARINYEIINTIKEYSQLKVYGWRRENDGMRSIINKELSKGLYFRKGSENDVNHFYNQLFRYTYYAKDLKG